MNFTLLVGQFLAGSSLDFTLVLTKWEGDARILDNKMLSFISGTFQGSDFLLVYTKNIADKGHVRLDT